MLCSAPRDWGWFEMPCQVAVPGLRLCTGGPRNQISKFPWSKSPPSDSRAEGGLGQTLAEPAPSPRLPFFSSHTSDQWKVPGQGSNPHHSSNPSYCSDCSDNVPSLTHSAKIHFTLCCGYRSCLGENKTMEKKHILNREPSRY